MGHTNSSSALVLAAVSSALGEAIVVFVEELPLRLLLLLLERL
jgi:hypothetical protein